MGSVEVESGRPGDRAAKIFARVFRELRPRTPLPEIRIELRPYANVTSTARLESNVLVVKLSDLFAGASEQVLEALAHLLLGKLFRKPVKRIYEYRFRRFVNRKDVRRMIDLVRRVRGKAPADRPRGNWFDLAEIFEELNWKYFQGLLPRPRLSWSAVASRRTLGRYDQSHNAIVVSRLLDSPQVPRLVVEYLMFHEMLHMKYPVEHDGVKRRIHTAEFRRAERQFERLDEAKRLLRELL